MLTSPYILVIVWIAVVALIFSNVQAMRIEYVMGKEEVRCAPLFAVLAVVPLIWWAGQRNLWFGDTGNYVRFFNGLPRSFSEFRNTVFPALGKDRGYYSLVWVIKVIVGENPTVYLTVIAAIQAMLLASAFRKYSVNYLLSLFLFIATTDYYSWMFNGIRQFTAATIMFAAGGFIYQKKYLQMILVILLASTFHASALLMLPALFFVQGEAWNRRSIAVLILVILAMRFVGPVVRILDSLLAETQYENVVSDWQSWSDNGTHPLRVLVYAVPTIIAFFGRKTIKKFDDPVVNVCVNMSIISTGLYLFSMVTSGIFIGRLPIYFSLFSNGILLPWELENLFTENSKMIVWLFMIVGFIGFYYYQMHIAWGAF